MASEYPSQWETHAVLKDGSTVEIRPIRASDRDALAEFHSRQSRESIYFRFFRYRPELTDKELDYFTTVDYRDRMAFVAVLGSDLVAIARYEKYRDRSVAEVAFFVDDAHHGLGLATLMLEYLAAAARDRGLDGFTATVLPENYRMLAVFRSAGYEVKTRFADGLIEVDLGIEVTEETSTAIADRDRLSTARSVARILEPTSIAVIGASRTPGTVGYELVRNLARPGTDGEADSHNDAAARLFPVNPNAATNSDLRIAGVKTYPTISAASAVLGDDQTIDLAIVAVRAELVEEVVQECAAAGVHGLLVISTGFSELSEAGREKERRLVELARTNGMRLIGPNAFGIINTHLPVPMHAMFHQAPVSSGVVALASQSGPLGTAVLDRLRVAGLGVSSFVGVGNRSDVSVNDLLNYWALDEHSGVVLLYLENFGNLRNFSAVASHTSKLKPVITIGPSSPELAELLRQAGVIQVDQVSQLADQALLAATQPVAKGNRVAIVSNTRSLARLAAQACRRHGLEVVVPHSLADIAAEGSVLIGDLDSVSLMPSSDPDDYERVTVTAAVSEEVDLVLAALAPTAYLRPPELASLLDRVNRSIDKPIAAIGLVGTDQLRVDRLPIFTFPEEAAQVLGRHAQYGLWRAAHGRPVDHPEPPPEAQELVDRLLAGREELTLTMADRGLDELLSVLSIPVAEYGLADSASEAKAQAERIGYPVVLKAASLADRSIGESGGAAIDLQDGHAVVAAYGRMAVGLGAGMQPAVVQEMIPSATLLRVELVQDPSFGSVISIGPGGSGLEAVEPTARRFAPLDDSSAVELIDASVESGVLAGLTDPARDRLMQLLMKISAAAAAIDSLAALSVNPVIVSGDATKPADVTVKLRLPRNDLLAGLRHL